MKSTAKILGDQGERRARRWLKKRGLVVIARNYRCKCGEIDLIAMDGGTVVFIEVRYRNRNATYGSAEDSITRSKQQKIVRSASMFLQQYPQYARQPCRFDALTYSDETGTPEWFIGAFD